jgi:cAMP and cAMP-inhibited cGMP 3',5'-cyclic phosphodiesterase 10
MSSFFVSLKVKLIVKIFSRFLLCIPWLGILQADGTDIFSYMSADDYKEMLELTRHHIIATDLALYFGNQKTLAGYIQDGTFNIKDKGMRRQLMALMMTGADLCACAKPWNTQH